MNKTKQFYTATILWGDLYSANRGVNALTISLIDLLKEKYQNIKFNIFAGNVNDILRLDNVTLYPIYKFCNPLKLKYHSIKNYIIITNVIIRSDVVVDLSEGDSFTDIYGLERFLCHFNIKRIAIWFSKKFILAPQTIGPFNSLESKIKAKMILLKTDVVTVRDLESKEYLEKIGFYSKQISVFPDLAFNLSPSNPDKIDKKCLECNPVGINVSGLLWRQGYTGKNEFGLMADYKKLCYKILEYFVVNSIHVTFIPHTYSINKNEIVEENDLNAMYELIDEFKSKNGNSDIINIIDKEYSASEIKWCISKMDFFIGARMHACIAACSTGVPFAALAYSRKFSGLFSYVGLKDSVIELKNQQNYFEDVIRLYSNRKYIKRQLIDKSINLNLETRRFVSCI